MVVKAQTSEVVEGDHLQVRPGESVWQFLADGFEDGRNDLLNIIARKRLQVVEICETLRSCVQRSCVDTNELPSTLARLLKRAAVI